MSLKSRVFYLALLDSFIVMFSIFLGYLILAPTGSLLTTVLIVSSITLLVSHHFFANRYKIYNRVWQYASMGELAAIFKVVTFSILITAVLQLVFNQSIFFRTLMITWMLHILLIGGSRFSWRLYRDTYIKRREDQIPTLIIGAGSGGTMVARQLLQNPDAELTPVAFIDDDQRKQGLEILGIPVLGTSASIEQVVKQNRINHIIIAIPSLSKKELNDIFMECSKTKARTQIIPKLEDLMVGKVSVNSFRDVEVEDLLGREPVELDTEKIGQKLTGKTILVTGAGGSIGSEVCRQVCSFGPETIVLLGHGENSIYSIELELKKRYPNIQVETEIADVQDREKIFVIMEKYKPHVVYHAAAHKHVPLMERNPEEAVKNNVVGTRNVAEAASSASVGTFVMVSTDKAVNPTNVMGATKRIAEMIVQHMDIVSDTKFVAVRFGNVLGSRGSVIPLFKKQIQEGGPVTVTHSDMVRYFMTIPEASRLVLQAGALARGGEVFVLDMGEPVKIVDLARNLIRLSGYTEEEIPIVFTGMRPGEKMFEELLGADEVHPEQIYPKIYIGKTPLVDINVCHDVVRDLDNLSKEELRKQLLDIANFRNKKLQIVG
ncbi:polysaccharide biosynthesis protein [Anaerobacillus alkaliphilus]|uniref:Polysaccharide biosynthesis protein n=1 Tax=Anaerobacillus alkaliphilus TaxID=1548597 RepID=A0A4Q0VU98_9BACI|nr:nucleoside-diphosphate sugar epimerase/dehydratase [Anaerobacillus alkaliphilus]RXJ02261.1 polysaccharide biosynthesis protein [Anaerobacillus alkaliphilus]